MTIEFRRPCSKAPALLVRRGGHIRLPGCARAFVAAPAAITYVNERRRPRAARKELAHRPCARCRTPGTPRGRADRITKEWASSTSLSADRPRAEAGLAGPLLFGRGLQTGDGHLCHSFVRMARLAAPLMKNGGSMFAMSYHGANKVVPNYNVMGPVKAALEASCRYLAFELGSKGIRVHAISPGPLKTRAASSLKDFDLLLTDAAQRAPIGELVDIMDVGFTCGFLATPITPAVSTRSTSTAA